MQDTILMLAVGDAVADVFGQWPGWRLELPAIIPLLVVGALAGPIAGIVNSSAAIGDVMRPAIGMAVAIIVFEGGLNLNLRELRSAGSGVLRLVAVALPLDWLLGALAAHFIAGLSWSVALLVGAIHIVTGRLSSCPYCGRPSGRLRSAPRRRRSRSELRRVQFDHVNTGVRVVGNVFADDLVDSEGVAGI